MKILHYSAAELLKFSEVDVISNFSNGDILDDKVIAIKGMPFYEKGTKITTKEINYIINAIHKYEVVIILDPEHIYMHGWIDLIKVLHDLDKLIIFQTFSTGIKHFLDRKIPNNKIIVNTVENLLYWFFQNNNGVVHNFDISKKRKFLLKHFSYNRNPQRDYITDFLLKNNLVENNNISFHNHPDNKARLREKNIAYACVESENILKNVDMEKLETLKIIPDTENFNIENQNLQINKILEANTNSYFEILSEAQTPMSDDPENCYYYTYSTTARTLNPILYGNVFHIMTDSKLYETELKKIGFQLFFENNDDFINSLSEQFYFDRITQFKLLNNFEVLRSINSKNIKRPFYIEKLEQIYSIKFK